MCPAQVAAARCQKTWQPAQPSGAYEQGEIPPQPAGRRRYDRKYQDQDPCRIPQLYVSSMVSPMVAPASSPAVAGVGRRLLRLGEILPLLFLAGPPYRER